MDCKVEENWYTCSKNLYDLFVITCVKLLWIPAHLGKSHFNPVIIPDLLPETE